MFSFFNSAFYDFELTRILGSTRAGGCDVAEFLEAVGKIRRHDPESWYTAWNELSLRAEQIGHEAAQCGYSAAARNAYLRASNYARACGYMLHFRDARVLEQAERSVSLFRGAIPFMEGRVLVLDVPYEGGVSLPGYLYLPGPSKKFPNGKTPVMINCAGADATQEELYYLFPAAGVELGYAVLTFEGPGQGMMLKRERTALRPDFENITAQVVSHLHRLDHEHQRSDEPLNLDLDRIVVAGGSLGAYYALRSSIDSHIKACVAVDPFYSLWDVALTRMPAWYAWLWTSGWLPDSVFNASVNMQIATSFPVRWEFGLGMSMMGTETPAQTLRRFQAFSLNVSNGDGSPILERIRCPVMLTGASRSIYSSAQDGTLTIYNNLSQVPDNCKEVWIPDELGSGGLTAKVGAWALLAQKSFQFLDKHLGIQRIVKASEAPMEGQ
ncbi:alpha/beta hydrolase [Hypoxylon crocopeplum]|nr:alpha/beta hydrolase [Hypoxylon crocopeplum]